MHAGKQAKTELQRSPFRRLCALTLGIHYLELVRDSVIQGVVEQIVSERSTAATATAFPRPNNERGRDSSKNQFEERAYE